MKKLFLLVSALAMLAACGNNDEIPVPQQEQEPVSINLQSMDYAGMMTLLSEQTSLKDVVFTDGTITRNVSELVASDNFDPQQANALLFTAANSADSVDMTVTPEYVAIRMNVNGEQWAYMTFADKNQQNEIVGLYEETIPATRGGESVVTRSVDNGSFSLNLTEVAQVMAARAEVACSSVLPERELKYQASVATRGWLSNLFNKIVAVFKPAPAPVVVKTPTIDIYMMKEKGANPLTHEMNWQVNDAISALKDVQSNVKFNVYIKDCDYKGTNNSEVTLEGFNSWLKKSSYRNTHGVFMLCRWGGYEWQGAGQVLGRAYLGDYNVNNDLEGCGIASTNAWNKHNVAHEIGHIFGADHVTPPWYQFVAGYDLMAYGLYPWSGSGKHKDAANRAEVKKRLTLK